MTREYPWADAEARWLASEELGAKFGAAIELIVPPGSGYGPYSHQSHERVVYVYSGEGQHSGAGGPSRVETDDVLVIPPGASHGFENTGSEPAKIWVAWTPDTTFPFDDYQDESGADVAQDGEIIRRKLKESLEDPDTTKDEDGFENLGIIWGGAEGADAITLGWVHFEDDGTHRMHRHPNGDEVLHIISGTGTHITPDGERDMVGPAYDFAPAGELHSMAARSGRVEGMFFYLGGATLEEAGYELAEASSD